MNPRSTVLIAAPDLLPLLKHVQAEGGELFVFSDIDMSQALEAITARRPTVIAIEKLFASTPRGVAFLNRIKADAALSHCEIRIVSPNGGQEVISAPPVAAAGPAASGTTAAKVPLDARGTRRVQRYKVAGALEIFIDGNPASLVDLSTVGAQVLSATVLKPNQRVRVSMADDHGTIRFNATIAWAAFEIPPKIAPRYRAGIEFIDADTRVISGYCLKYEVT